MITNSLTGNLSANSVGDIDSEPARDSLFQIPERIFFRIGDVSEILGVKPYVLRYWETEFSAISPQKSNSGQRVYRRADVETLFVIKHLLYVERYSIDGARRKLKELRREGTFKSYKDKVGVTQLMDKEVQFVEDSEMRSESDSPHQSFHFNRSGQVSQIERAAAQAAAAALNGNVKNSENSFQEIGEQEAFTERRELYLSQAKDLASLAADKVFGNFDTFDGEDFQSHLSHGTGATAAGFAVPFESTVISGLKVQRLSEIIGAARDLNALAESPLSDLYG